MPTFKSLLRLGLSVVLLFLWAGVLLAQQVNISGTINDTSGNPIPGATIIVKGTQIGTVSDIDGNFKISGNIPAGS